MKSNKEVKLEEALALVQEVAVYDEALKPVAEAIQNALTAKADEEFDIWWIQNCHVVRNTVENESLQSDHFYKTAQLAWRAAKRANNT